MYKNIVNTLLIVLSFLSMAFVRTDFTVECIRETIYHKCYPYPYAEKKEKKEKKEKDVIQECVVVAPTVVRVVCESNVGTIDRCYTWWSDGTVTID